MRGLLSFASWAKIGEEGSTYIMPLFHGDIDNLNCEAAWDGFLGWWYLNPEVAELMEPAFLAALPQLEIYLNRKRERFVEFVAAYLVYFASDPLNTWIPGFFRYANNKARNKLALSIKGLLSRMDEDKQKDLWRRWLKEYWVNRLQGVPAELVSNEIEPMIGWVLKLSAVFPEAVALAVRLQQVPMRNFSFLRELGKNELPERYPNEVAQLLIYLGASGSPGYVWHGLKELIDKIGLERLRPDYRQKLEEVMARLGI